MSAKKAGRPRRTEPLIVVAPAAPCSPGSVIKAQISKLGTRQIAACKRLGLDKKSLCQICNGKVRLTAKMAVLIEHYLYLDARKLLVMQVDCDLWNLRENAALRRDSSGPSL